MMTREESHIWDAIAELQKMVGVLEYGDPTPRLGRPPTEPPVPLNQYTDVQNKQVLKCGVCMTLKGVERIQVKGIKPATFEEPGVFAIIRPVYCPACGEKL